MTEQKRAVDITDDAYREAAKNQYQSDGEIEIDDNATISRGDGLGAYVQAWVWVYDDSVATDGCGKEGPEGYRCTHHENGEHVARGAEPGSFAESWQLVKPSIGEWRYSANEANYFRLLKDAKRGYVLEWCEYQPTPDTPDINIGEVEASAFDTFQAFSDFCVVMGGLFNVDPAEIMRSIK